MKAVHWVVAAITFLAVLGAWSRLTTAPNTATTIKNGADALTKLFNGAFGL